MVEDKNLEKQKEIIRCSLDSQDLFIMNGCIIGTIQEVLPCLPVVNPEQAAALQSTVHLCVMIQSKIFHQALEFDVKNTKNQEFLFRRAEIHFIAHQVNHRINSLNQKKEDAVKNGFSIPESLSDSIIELQTLMGKLPEVELEEPSKIITL